MYSEKDTCCFCVPLYVGVIVIFMSTIIELLGALAEQNAWNILVTLGMVVCFIVTAFFRTSVCVRRFLAFAYVISFVLEVIITTLIILAFFKMNYPYAYCEGMQKEGKLAYGSTLNECALFVGQYFIVFVFMGIAYSFPMKLFFSYVLFKYAHQLIATEEGI